MAAQISLAATFLVHALLFASWTAHIPQIESRLGLSDGALGTALLGAPIGSITAMTVSGWALSRLGSHRVVRIAIAGYAVSGIAVGMVGSTVELFLALALWGLFQGTLDVAMNTQAVTVERAVGTPIMSRLHGVWSIGGFLGALVGSGAVATGIGLSPQLALLGVPAILVLETLSRYLIPDGGAKPDGGEPLPPLRRRLRPSAVVLALSGIAFASMLCEGAVADWSANYLHNELRAGAALSGLGYAAYALAMVTMRLSGTFLQGRFRNRVLLPILAVIAAAGMSVALLTRQPVTALIGFAAMGIGLALLVPSAFSAAGSASDARSNSGSAIATVSALGWLGFVSGPPLIGHLADLTGLGTALWVLPLLTLIIAGTARFGTAFAERAAPDGRPSR